MLAVNTLIHAGDQWILLVTVASFYALRKSHKLVKVIGAILLLLTTILISQRYSIARGLIHSGIIVLLLGITHLLDKLPKRA